MEKVTKARHWVKSHAGAANLQSTIWPYQNLKMHSLFDSPVPLLGTYSTDAGSHIWNDIHTMLVTVVLLAADWKQLLFFLCAIIFKYKDSSNHVT